MNDQWHQSPRRRLSLILICFPLEGSSNWVRNVSPQQRTPDKDVGSDRIVLVYPNEMGSRRPLVERETKIFDPRDASTGSGGAELLDASVAQRREQWCLYLAGQVDGHGATDIYAAYLPSGAPLAATGWQLQRGGKGELTPAAGRSRSRAWDGNGGRHCPSYVKGWDNRKGEWVERIYYAGSAEHLWGPYTIGFLEWDGDQWADQSEPVFSANEDWEHGSVYEPNLIYHEGKWRMWYVAGSNHEDYLLQGYAESEDGRTGWSKHIVFAPREMKMFDFCVRPRQGFFDAIFSRVWVGGGAPPPQTGLWWCRAASPSNRLSEWSKPVQIMTAEDRGWHSGPWKPSFDFQEDTGERAVVFFDGCYRTDEPGPFPFAFTLGCVDIHLPGESEGHSAI
jgi:hypothetical protein